MKKFLILPLFIISLIFITWCNTKNNIIWIRKVDNVKVSFTENVSSNEKKTFEDTRKWWVFKFFDNGDLLVNDKDGNKIKGFNRYTINSNKVSFLNDMWFPLKSVGEEMARDIKSIQSKKKIQVIESYSINKRNITLTYVWPNETKLNNENINYPSKTFTGEPNFRNLYWWMSPQDVKKTEKEFKYVDSGEWIMLYTWVLNNKIFDLYLYFIDNVLVKANYYLKEEYTNKNEYINIYKKFKTLFSEKYWKNLSEYSDWFRSSNLFKNNPSDWWLAVSYWDLTYISSWEDAKTNIWIVLDWNNFEIRLLIEYIGKEFSSIINEHAKKESLSDL